jgi:(2Fe-2S) ferredoxin
VNNAGCLGRCDKGPVLVVYPEGVWYSVNSPEDMREVLTAHVIKGGRCERLLVPAS